MKKLNRGAFLLALGVVVAVPAQASDKKDFEACDGRVHPAKQSDGMRGEAPQGMFPTTTSPNVTIAACTRALASPRLLPGQSLRRAHLLRARAAAELKSGDTAKALADLDLAEAATPNLVADPFYNRSMAVSLKLLRAIALAHSGDLDGAMPLARAASEARPYSLQVQQAAAAILQAGRPVGTASPSPWTPMARLAPKLANTAVMREAEIGNFAAVRAMRPAVQIEWPTTPLQPLALLAQGGDSTDLLSNVVVSLHLAYADAAAGDSARARSGLEEVRAKISASRPVPNEKASGLEFGANLWSALDRYIEVRGRQIDARIAVAEARPADAIAALVAAPMPRDAATIELLTALKTAAAANQTMVPDVTPFSSELAATRKKELLAAIPSALLAPETPRAVVDYERARPNILGALVGGALSLGTSLLGGIDRTDGFRTTDKPDGTIQVEFIGNTPSATLVQEMTLLRAAEVARSKGKPGFVIVERQDFARRLNTMRYGATISSVAQGFKTELTIRCVDAGVEPERALDAVAIIDSLGPLYYEEKSKNS